jgi:hypothetical protein
MSSIFCPGCRLEQPTEHRYCIRCGVHLPVHLLEPGHPKRARWFPAVKVADDDPEQGFLRVSCYLTEQRIEAPGGEPVIVPGRHVRFSVWDGEAARCVVSIPEAEARALAEFISDELWEVDPRLARTEPFRERSS